MERKPDEGYREELDEKVERYMSKRNRRIKRRWAAGILSAVLVLTIGWNCLFDGASWFQWANVNAYQGGTIEVLEDPEVPLSSVPVIKEGGEYTAPSDDQGTETTGGLVAFPDYAIQEGVSDSGGQEPAYQAPEVSIRQMSALETEIVREGGAYAQVINGNTPIYTTSLLNDWFAMVDVGIVYASYYYVTDGMPDAVQVTFNSDYGIVMGYMYAGDLELLDKESTVRLLVEVSQVSTYFDAERQLPLAWVWYVPKGVEIMQQETQQNNEDNQLVVVDWQEEDFNPENILSIMQENEVQPEDGVPPSDTDETDVGSLAPSIIDSVDEGNAADPVPTGLVEVNSILGNLVPGLTTEETPEEETAGQEIETEEDSPEEVIEETPEISEEPLVQESGDKLVNTAHVLNSLVPGLSALETNNTSTQETESTDESVLAVTEEETDTTTDEPVPESIPGSDKVGNTNVLINLIPGLAAMEENQAVDSDTIEEETEPLTDGATEVEEETDEAGEPDEAEDGEAEEPGETGDEPVEPEEDAAESDEPAEDPDDSDTTDLDESETDDGSEAPEAGIQMFVPTQPENVPEYYQPGENDIYWFTDLSETTHYRVHGTVNDENEGFYISDAQGIIGEPAVQADLAADLALVTPVEQETEGEDGQDTGDTTEETPEEEDGQIEAVQFEATDPAAEAMPAYYQESGPGLYTFTDIHDIAHYRVHGYVNGDAETEGFYVANEEGSLVLPAQLVDFAAEAQLLNEEEEVPGDIDEDEASVEETVFTSVAVPEGLLPAYYAEVSEGVYTFVGRDESDYFRVYGILNEEVETEGFYASDVQGLINSPAQKIDLMAEAEELAPQAEPEVPDETPPPLLQFTAAEPAGELVPAFYMQLENGTFAFTAHDGQAYYRAYGYIGDASDWTGFYAAQDESGELVYPAVVIDVAEDAALMEGPEELPAFERMEAPADAIPAFYTSFQDEEGLIAYAFAEFAGAQHYRVYGSIVETSDTGFFAADEQGAVIVPYVLADMVADEALVFTPVYKFAYTAPQQEVIPDYYKQNSAENPVYSFTGRDETTTYSRIHGLVNGEAEGFYASSEDGTLIEPPQWIDLAQEAADLSPVADENAFVHTLADAQSIPEFYEMGTLDSGDALFSFADREDTTHYRVHGMVSGGAEGFYATEADGGLIAPYVPVNTEDDYSLTQDIPVFVPKAAPADMPYYYTTNKQAEEAGESFDAMLSDEGEAESEGFSLGSIFGFLFATAYADTVETDVFSFIDRNGEWQYRVYGVVGDLEGWFVADEFGNPVDLFTVVDLAEEIALMTTSTPLISARGLYNFAYTPVTPTKVPEYYSIFHAGKSSIIYGFEGRPDDDGNVGDMYYRVYVDPNDGREVGFYECDRYGENLGNKVDLQDEDLTKAPYRYQGVIFSGTLPNSDYERAPDSIATYAYQYPSQDLGKMEYRIYAYIVNKVYPSDPPKNWLALSNDVSNLGEVTHIVKDINLDSDNLWAKGFIEREVMLDSASISVPEYYGLASAVNNDDTIRARTMVWSFINRNGVQQYRVYGYVDNGQAYFYPCDPDGNVKRGAQPIDLEYEYIYESPLTNGLAPVFIPGIVEVSAADVTAMKDGLVKLDATDKGLGYDTSETNKKVRSYDGVLYTISYVTNLTDPNGVYQGFSEADIYLRAELPITHDKHDAMFDLGAMPWLLDATNVYDEAGKKWILQGRYTLDGGAKGEIAVPNAGTLALTVQVYGMLNGDTIQPSIAVWMDKGEGNNTNYTPTGPEIVQGVETVTVTAGPYYNAALVRGPHFTHLNSVDFSTGELSVTGEAARTIQLGLMFMLDNGDSDRGMMGVERPTGTITATFEMHCYRTAPSWDGSMESVIVPASGSYSNMRRQMPKLWDYTNAQAGLTRGALNRTLFTELNGIANMPHDYMPGNANGDDTPRDDQVYKSGNWTVWQETPDWNAGKAVFHVSVSDYDFSTWFPKYNYASPGQNVYGIEQGVFSVGMIDISITSVDGYLNQVWDHKFTARLTALNINSVNAGSVNINTQTRKDDDYVEAYYSIYPTGRFSKSVHLGRDPYTSYYNLASGFGEGDAKAARGTPFWLTGTANIGNERASNMTVGAFDLLMKFDPLGMTPLDDGPMDYGNYHLWYQHLYGGETHNLLYGALKNNAKQWSSDTALKNAVESDFDWYRSHGELKAAGGTCAAILLESRGMSIPIDVASQVQLMHYMVVADTAVVGNVYMIVNDLSIWLIAKGSQMTTLNASRLGGSLYLDSADWAVKTKTGGDTGPGYHAYYQENYEKSTYDANGVMNGGHTAGYLFGGSLMVIGEVVNVSKYIEQVNPNGTNKSVFDIGKAEYRVDYRLQPALHLDGGTASYATPSTVVVEDILPAGVTYDAERGAYLGGTHQQTGIDTQSTSIVGGTRMDPVVTYPGDGTTKLSWTFYDVVPGTVMEHIHFTAIMGDPLDPSKSPRHAATITNHALIDSTRSKQQGPNLGGKEHKLGLTVTNFEDIKVMKSVREEIIDRGENIVYDLVLLNNAPKDMTNVAVVDVLPFDNDLMGSSFDGSYVIESITVEKTGVNGGTLDVYVTDDGGKRKPYPDYTDADRTSSDWRGIGTFTGDKVTLYPPAGMTDFTAVMVKGDIDELSRFVITITLKTTGNKAGDIYYNKTCLTGDSINGQVIAAPVQTVVVDRSISGRVWHDANENGRRDDYEELLRGVTVSLWRTDGTLMTHDTANNPYGSGGYITTGSDGAYEFLGVPAGDYEVLFESGSLILGKYVLTAHQKVGVSNTRNSDAVEEDTNADGTLKSASISVHMPGKYDMTVSSYAITDMDMGLHAPISFIKSATPAGDTDTPVLEGDVIDYVITVTYPERGVKKTEVSDVVPEGLTVISGSIWYQLSGGPKTNVTDNAFSHVKRTIYWPEVDLVQGANLFGFSALVNKLARPADSFDIPGLTYVNQGIITSRDPKKEDKTNLVTHESIGRSIELHKTAALIAVDDDNDIDDPLRGESNAPVPTDLNQKVEYRLTLINHGTTSGEIEVTDKIPRDMKYVDNTLDAWFVAGADGSTGSVVSMTTENVAETADEPAHVRVKWVVTGMAPGEQAELRFWAQMPKTADDPLTEDIVEIERIFVNQATAIDIYMRDKTYGVDTGDHGANDEIWPDKEDWTAESEETYHRITEPIPIAVKTSDKQKPGAFGDDPSGLTIVPNKGKDSQIEYTITLTNNSTGSTLLGARIRDYIPEGTKFISVGEVTKPERTVVDLNDETDSEEPRLTWTIDKLSPGEEVSVRFTVEVLDNPNGAVLIENKAYYDRTNPTGDPDENPPEETNTLENPVLWHTKLSSPTGVLREGQRVTYLIHVEVPNVNGDWPLVTVADTVPDRTTYVRNSIHIDDVLQSDSKYSAGTISFINNEPLAPGRHVFRFSVVVGKLPTGVNEMEIRNAALINGEPTTEVKQDVKSRYADITKKSRLIDFDGTELAYNNGGPSFAERVTAEFGQEIEYHLTVEAKGATGLEGADLIVTDVIPNLTQVSDTDFAPVITSGSAATVSGPSVLTNAQGQPYITWTIKNLKVGESVELTFRVRVDAQLPEGESVGLIDNMATLLDKLIEQHTYESTVYDENGDIIHHEGSKVYTQEEIERESNMTHHKVLDPERDVVFVKTADPLAGTKVQPGDIITYSLTTEVVGQPITGVTLTDMLPDGVHYVENSMVLTHTALDWTVTTTPIDDADGYDPQTHTIELTGLTLERGTTELSYQVLVGKLPDNVSQMTIRNHAVYDDGETREEKESSHTVITRYAEIRKTAALVEGENANGLGGSMPYGEDNGIPDPVDTEKGQVVEYHIYVKNVSDGGLTSGKIVVTDQVPQYTTLIPGSITAEIPAKSTFSEANGLITWELFNLNPGEEMLLTFRVWAPTSIPDGSFSLIFRNIAEMTDVERKEETYEETVRVYDRDGNVTEYTSGSAIYEDTEVTKQSEETQHIIREANVVGEKDSDKSIAGTNMGYTVKVGDTIRYTIRVTNDGAKAAENVRIRDAIPAGTEYVTGTGMIGNVAGGSYNSTANHITFDIPRIEVGQTIQVFFTVRVVDIHDAAGELITIVNQAFYDKDINLDDPSDDPKKPTEEVKNPTMEFEKTSNAGAYVKEGQAIDYTIAVKSSANLAERKTIRDILPEGVILDRESIYMQLAGENPVKLDAATHYDPATRTITWPDVVLKAGENLFTYTVVVAPLPTGVLERQLKNTAQTTGGGWEEEIVTVKRRYADIWKEAQLIPLTGIDEGGLIANGTPDNPVQTAPGQRVEYTLRVENISADGLVSGDIIIYDPIPEHTTYVTGSMTTPVFSAGGTGTVVSMDDSTGTPTWVVTGMSPGETVDVKFRVIAPTPPADGSITFINSGWLTDVEVKDTTYDRTIFDENGNEIATSGETVRETEEYEVESNKTYHIVEDTPVRIVKGSTPSDGSVVREGQKIDYTILVYVEDRGQSRVLEVSDTIMDGLVLLENTVSPSAFTYENRVLTWDAFELNVGENKFTFSAIVERLDDDEFEKDLGNIAVVKDPNDPTDPGKPSNEVKHTVKRRYAELEKTAALVTKYGTDGLHGILDPRDDGRDEPVVTKIGQVVEYIITVTNRGSLASKEIDVWDTIPTGTTLVPGSISDNGMVAGSRIDWTITMLPGETRELTFRVWAPETTDDPTTPDYETERHFYNKANLKDWELTQIQYEATFVDDEGIEYKVNETVYEEKEYELETEDTHHVVYEPLIDMVKTSDRMRQNTPSVTGQLVFPGDEITYTLTVTNNGSKVAEDVMIRDYIPEGTTFKEVLDNHGGQLYTLGTKQHVTWIIDSLAAGDTIELIFVVTVDELTNGPILIRNAGLYDPHPEEPGDPDPEDPVKPPVDPEDPVDPPEETPEVTNPTVIIEKTADPADGTQVSEGEAIAYTITVTVSEGGAQGVTVSDPLPDGVYFVPGSIKYKLGTSPEVTLADSAYNLGTHTVTWLRNNRPLDLPEGVSTFKVDVVVAKLGDDDDGNPILEKDLVNHALIKTQEREDPPIDPPTVAHTVKNRYASIDKTAALIIGNSADGLGGTRLGFDRGTADDPVDTEFGQVVEYHITVQNHGDLQSDRINVRDMIPEHTTLVPDSISHNGTVQNGEIIWVINRLAEEGEAGDSVTLTFRVWAPEGLNGEETRRLVFENQATLTDRAKQIAIYEKEYMDENGDIHSEREAVYTEEEYTEKSPITYHEVSKPKLSLTKTAEPAGDVKEGQVIKYTITVTVENKKAEGIDVIDWIPHGVVLLEDTVTSSIDGLSHTYNRHAGNNMSERQLKWGPTDMEVGEHTFTYEVVVRKLDEGVTYLELNNAATVTDPYKEPGEEDPKVVITNTVRSRYSKIEKNAALLENGVALEKDPGTLANPVQTGPGQKVEYYLTVTNITQGGIRSGLISVTDVLPEGTEYVEDSMSAVGSDPRIVSANYDDATRTLTWEIEDLGIEDPDNAIELVFQVTAPDSAMIFENQAILVDEDLTEIEYEKTFTDEDGNDFTEGGTVYEREEVTRPSNETYHEVKMPEVSLIKTASPEGDVREGQVIHYTITVTVENGTASGIEVTDWIPEGVTLLEDTVTTSVQNVQHSYDRTAGANGDERRLKWGPMDLTVGDHTFEYDVIVRALPEGVTYLELNNAASVTNPNGEDPKVVITNTVRSRYAEIEKNAALITDGEPEEKDPGTLTSPVQTDAGQTVEYYLTVRNVTDADLESGEIIVTDVLPEGTSYVDDSMTPASADARIKSSSYSAATRTLTWVLEGLGTSAPESEIVLTFRVTAPTEDSLFINQATLTDEELKVIEYEKTFTDEDGNEWTEGDTVRETEEIEKDSNETFHEVKIPVVTLEKSASHEEVREGQIITYTVKVEVENAPLKGYTLTDTIPDGVTLLESTVSPAPASYNKDKASASYKQLVWGPEDLAVGEYTYEYKVIVNPLPEGVTRLAIRNAVVIGSTNPPWEPENPPKSETETIVKSRYAEIEKNAALITDGELEEKDPGTAENPVQTDPGQTVEYYLTVRNVSDTGLSSGRIIVTDVLPEGTTYVPGSMSVPGDDARILRAEYDTATRTLHWELDGLTADAPGDEITLVFRVTAPRSAQLFINQAVLEDEELKEITHETTYTDEDGNEWTEKETVRETEEIEKESNETFHEVKEPIVTLEKTASHEEVREGQIITYTVNVTVEEAPLKGYTLTDTIPDGVTLLESTVSPAPASYNKDKASAGYKQLVWGPENLAIGEYTYEYKVIVNPLPEGVTRLEIRNAVVIGSTTPPWEPENPPKSETETIVKSRYAEIEKNAALITDGELEEKDPGTAENPVQTDPGQTVEYYLTVRNVSDTGLSSGRIIVTDVLPEGTTYAPGSMSVPGDDARILRAEYDTATRTLHWELDGLTADAPGDEITLVFRVTAPRSAQLFINQAVLEDEELKEITHETTYTDEDGNEWTENETVRETEEIEKESNETFHEVKEPIVTLEKTASHEEVREGQIITYTVNVTVEEAPLKGYTLTDTIPDGVTLLESTVSPAPASYNKDKTSASYKQLVWGPEDLAVGEYTYEYKVIVNPLPEGVTRLAIRNAVVIGSTTPPWEPENPPKSETETTVKSRYAEISKNAALITDGTPEAKNPGTATNPVDTNPDQTVEYYLTVKNVSDTGLSSGKIIVTDVLPQGTTYVPGSMSVPGNDARIVDAQYDAATRTLRWELDNLTAAAPGNEITLVFRVTAPTNAQLFVNKAVLEDEELKEITHETTYTDEDGNEWTENETVREIDEVEKESNETFHEVKEPKVTVTKEASRSEAKEGQIVTYTVRVKIEDAMVKGYTLTDTVPAGVTLLESTVQPAYTSYTKDKSSADYHKLVWGPEDKAAGEYTYTYQVVVNPLPEGVTKLELRNLVVVGSTNPPWEPENPPKSETLTTVKSRYAEISKNAALVTNGIAGSKNPGTATNPVNTAAQQTVEYYLTVKNVSEAGLSSGRIVVTDVLPAGTAYVAGSMSAVGTDTRIVEAAYDSATRTLRWVLNGLGTTAPGNEITLVFRVTAPTSAQLFVNKAGLEDEERKETTTETTYTDEDGKTWTEGETVVETDDVTKESNPTYHEVVATVTPTPTPTPTPSPTPVVTPGPTSTATTQPGTGGGGGGGSGSTASPTPTASPTATPSVTPDTDPTPSPSPTATPRVMPEMPEDPEGRTPSNVRTYYNIDDIETPLGAGENMNLGDCFD